MISAPQASFSIKPIYNHLKSLKSIKLNYTSIIILSSLSAVANLVIPSIFSRIINGFQEHNGINILIFIALLFLVQEFQTILDLRSNYIRSKFSSVSNQDIISQFYNKIQSLPMIVFKKFQHTGEIYQRVIDTLQLNHLVTDVAIRFVLGILRLFILISVITWLDIRIGLIALSLIPTYYFLHRLVAPRLRTLQDATFLSNAPLTTALFDGLNKIRTIKAMGAKDQVLRNVADRLDQFLEAQLRLVSYSSRVSFLNATLTHVARFLVVVYIAWRVLQGELALHIGISLVFISQQVFEPMQSFIELFVDMTRSLSILARYTSILAEPNETLEHKAQKIIDTRQPYPISFENIHFSYGDKAVLANLSLHIAPGSRIALVGRSGSGKTTLINLLLGLYRPSSGTIRVNGIDLLDLDLTRFRKQVGVVLQEDFLFPGTLRQNVTFGLDRPCSDEAVTRALTAACLWERFASNPQPLDVSIQEGALSGGEVQRLILARAFLRDPALLVFDEPTSSLDLETETQIQTSMDVLLEGRTSITIAHRLSTIMKSNLIYVLDQGKIVEHGTHQELIEKEGFYYQLYCNSIVA